MKCVVTPIRGPFTLAYALKTEVVPLPVLPLNETEYQDVVKILEYYEQLFHRIKEKAGSTQDHLQAGGDQLTAERFRYYFLLY